MQLPRPKDTCVALPGGEEKAGQGAAEEERAEGESAGAEGTARSSTAPARAGSQKPAPQQNGKPGAAAKAGGMKNSGGGKRKPAAPAAGGGAKRARTAAGAAGKKGKGGNTPVQDPQQRSITSFFGSPAGRVGAAPVAASGQPPAQGAAPASKGRPVVVIPVHRSAGAQQKGPPGQAPGGEEGKEGAPAVKAEPKDEGADAAAVSAASPLVTDLTADGDDEDEAAVPMDAEAGAAEAGALEAAVKAEDGMEAEEGGVVEVKDEDDDFAGAEVKDEVPQEASGGLVKQEADEHQGEEEEAKPVVRQMMGAFSSSAAAPTAGVANALIEKRKSTLQKATAGGGGGGGTKRVSAAAAAAAAMAAAVAVCAPSPYVPAGDPLLSAGLMPGRHQHATISAMLCCPSLSSLDQQVSCVKSTHRVSVQAFRPRADQAVMPGRRSP